MKIKDIAKITGVSTATVSRVINDDPNVSHETREKIKKAIDDTGYIPNFLGRNLRISKTYKILLIIPTIDNPFYTEILEAIEESAETSGYTILIGITNNKPELENKYMEMLTTKQVDGAIVFLSNYDKDELSLWAKNFPLVQCCEHTPGSMISSVCIENFEAAYEAVSYLISKGHRDIGAVGGELYFASERKRADGYKKALSDHGIPYKTEYFCIEGYSIQGGQNGAKELMALERPPTAIFAFGDTIAIGVSKYLNDIGKPAAELAGDGVAIRNWAIEEMKLLAKAAKNMGVEVVSFFTGSSIWRYLYSFPQTTEEMIEEGYEEVYRLWTPILDVYDREGVKLALEVHPTEIAFDYYTAERLLKKFHRRETLGFTFDPSHLLWQGVNPTVFLRDFADRVYNVHMKDVKINKDGKAGILGSHIEFGDTKRGWNFVSIGHGNVNFEEIIREFIMFT